MYQTNKIVSSLFLTFLGSGYAYQYHNVSTRDKTDLLTKQKTSSISGTYPFNSNTVVCYMASTLSFDSSSNAVNLTELISGANTQQIGAFPYLAGNCLCSFNTSNNIGLFYTNNDVGGLGNGLLTFFNANTRAANQYLLSNPYLSSHWLYGMTILTSVPHNNNFLVISSSGGITYVNETDTTATLQNSWSASGIGANSVCYGDFLASSTGKVINVFKVSTRTLVQCLIVSGTISNLYNNQFLVSGADGSVYLGQFDKFGVSITKTNLNTTSNLTLYDSYLVAGTDVYSINNSGSFSTTEAYSIHGSQMSSRIIRILDKDKSSTVVMDETVSSGVIPKPVTKGSYIEISINGSTYKIRRFFV